MKDESLLELKRNSIKDTPRVEPTNDNIVSKMEKEWPEMTTEFKKLQRAKKGLSLYEQSICPHCESKLDTKFHTHRKEEFQYTIDTVPNKLEDIESNIKELRIKAADNRGKQEQIIGRVSSLNTSINTLKQNLIDITNSFKAGDQYKQLNGLITEFKDKETKKIEK